MPKLAAFLDGRTFNTVVEPFCGGASVSLGLLLHNITHRAEISDADPLLASFWIAATETPMDLIDLMHSEAVTVDRWKHWKSIDPSDTLQRGFKALFLNRTSFSGLINHGSVLGGVNQEKKIADGETVKYPVDCRFNKAALARSIERIGAWHAAGRLVARECDYADSTPTSAGDLLYLDPPYVEKSAQLYKQSYVDDDHRNIAEFAYTVARGGSDVLISYDNEPLIRSLYADPPFTAYTPEWAYGMGAVKASREILLSTIHGGVI